MDTNEAVAKALYEHANGQPFERAPEKAQATFRELAEIALKAAELPEQPKPKDGAKQGEGKRSESGPDPHDPIPPLAQEPGSKAKGGAVPKGKTSSP